MFSQEVLGCFHRKCLGVFTGSLKVFSQEVKYLVYVGEGAAQALGWTNKTTH